MKRIFTTLSCAALFISAGIFYYIKNNADSLTEITTEINGLESKHIIFNTMPKSGSVYITKTLAQGLNIPFLSVSPGYMPHDNINPEQLGKFYSKNLAITQEHFDASVFNTQLLTRQHSKIILHMRDPRQACLSWAHHCNTLYKQKQYDLLYYVAPAAPIALYEKDLTTQIDWHIENYLPILTKWMQDWFDYIDSNPEKVKILVVTYEQFMQDKDKYIDNILDFYEIPKEHFKGFTVKKDASSHFRRGSPNEWESVMTREQINRCNELVPPQLLSRLSIINNT